MKLISMLLALLIVGYLILQQIDKPTSNDSAAKESQDETAPPKVPTRQQDVQKFDQDINKFMDESKEKMDRQLEQTE